MIENFQPLAFFQPGDPTGRGAFLFAHQQDHSALGDLARSGSVLTIPVKSPGSGYTSAPTLHASDPDVEGGTPAQVELIFNAGALTSLTVQRGGLGYLNPPVVSLSGGAYTTAAVLGTPTISASQPDAVPGMDLTQFGGSSKERKQWVQEHQTIHEALSARAHTSVPDLWSYDLTKAQVMQEWLFYHAAVHGALWAALDAF